MPIRSLRQRVRSAIKGPVRPAAPVDPATGANITPGAQPHVSSLLEDHEQQIVDSVRNFTMVSTERLLAIMDAVKYVVDRKVPGALLECGVWRGGSVLTMIKTLQHLGVSDRDVYLYDTFEGMTQPSDADTSPFEQSALETWKDTPDGTRPWDWAFDSEVYGLDFVKHVIAESGYPPERVHFVQGPVEETIPGTLPEATALARLDTDWYESTLHELIHFYPTMPSGAVLIIDDFGHWEGARRAVEEFFDQHAAPMLLTRTDYTGRMGVKL